MTATLTLIALALALPRTRIEWLGGGHTLTHLIQHHHGCHCWRQPCHYLQDNDAKDGGCGNRRGCHSNICGREEVGHYNPIGMEQQKINKKIEKSGGNLTASAPVDSYAHAAATAASA
jgi:hypothetical protein